jgi:hypothetical protein
MSFIFTLLGIIKLEIKNVIGYLAIDALPGYLAGCHAAFLCSKIEPKTRSTRRSLKTHPAFGLWKDRNIDAVNYQQNLRSEWDE